MYQNYMQQPYMPYQPYFQSKQQNKLPPQQALKANGKTSIDMLEMSPNSDVLIMDTTAPRVWYCVSDGLGNVKATPYRVTVETDLTEPSSIEERLSKLEATLSEMEGKINESYVKQSESKQGNHEYKAGQGLNEHPQNVRQSSDDDATVNDKKSHDETGYGLYQC